MDRDLQALLLACPSKRIKLSPTEEGWAYVPPKYRLPPLRYYQEEGYLSWLAEELLSRYRKFTLRNLQRGSIRTSQGIRLYFGIGFLKSKPQSIHLVQGDPIILTSPLQGDWDLLWPKQLTIAKPNFPTIT